MPPTKFKFPTDPEHWEEAIKKAGLQGVTINDLMSMKSASKATIAQFLVHRILMVSKGGYELKHEANLWGLERSLPIAERELQDDMYFQNYVQSV
ncbi:hypothetical protein BO71DRAFT_401367 [Aspergillus ellipticus CBS 707.79]|uniref:Uncharacterized protein n=1 Tax=Aspergillus ellipticus CBS 707.79 TaxID=1448320 RepID=A0A319DTS4_9EURO|nr:hypothetical protein BO71DRAFT_401367 [Aspergillus ellipticus CBS 707.79]